MSRLCLRTGEALLKRVRREHLACCPCQSCTFQRALMAGAMVRERPLMDIEHLGLVMLTYVDQLSANWEGAQPWMDAERWGAIVDAMDQCKARVRGNRAAELGFADRAALFEAVLREVWERYEQQQVQQHEAR